MSMKRKPYPAWVCSDCGDKETMVTEPRDYGHLDFEVWRTQQANNRTIVNSTR